MPGVRIPRGLLIGCAAVVLFTLPAGAQSDPPQYENLQVLPSDISRDELNEIMLANLRGLGLRRLEGRGCLYCHVGSMDEPAKRKARVMMAMVREINQRHLSSLDARIDESFEVSCYTCHAGRTDPRPLDVVLWQDYEAGGLDSLTARYHQLRERYFAGDAYDFRVNTLLGLSSQMAGRGAFDDAVALADLNANTFDDVPGARGAWLQLVLLRATFTRGVDAALRELDSIAPTLPPEVLTVGVLNSVAWTVYRQDRREDGVRFMRRNYEMFPGEYIPLESLVFTTFEDGDREEAFRMLQSWLDDHPDHDRARRLMVNLRNRP